MQNLPSLQPFLLDGGKGQKKKKKEDKDKFINVSVFWKKVWFV